MTPLDKTLKRALKIDGIDYVVSLTPELLKLTRKGKRLGVQLKWSDITSGESALAIALRASVGVFEEHKTNEARHAANAPLMDPARHGERIEWHQEKGRRAAVEFEIAAHHSGEAGGGQPTERSHGC